MSEMQGFVSALTSIVTGSTIINNVTPKSFELNSVYPNPFNSTCNIKISIATKEKVHLTIYDTLGRKIKTLLKENIVPGEHNIQWDGKDVFGKTVASGMYIFSLVQGDQESSVRATLVR
jgi:flagellar hook assembly protein FlgD